MFNGNKRTQESCDTESRDAGHVTRSHVLWGGTDLDTFPLSVPTFPLSPSSFEPVQLKNCCNVLAGGGDRSQGGRHTQQNGSVQKTGGSKGGAAVPESVDEWPALPSLPVNNHLKPAVAAATQNPGTEANGWVSLPS